MKQFNKLSRLVSNQKAAPLLVVAVFAVVGVIFIWRSSANPNLPGDINNDNIVNITDLSILLSNWGKTYTPTNPTPTPPVPAPTPTPPAPTPTPPPPGSGSVPVGSRVVFTGNFDNGWSGYSNMQNRDINSGPGSYCAYPACIKADGPGHETAARFEIRSGDVPNFGGGERTEVRASGAAEVREGDERWYEFSLKFDQNFPNPTGGWFIIMQWHSGSGSPPLALEVSRDGQLKLQNNRGESPPKTIGPIKRGQWTNYVLRVKFANSSSGYVEAWENGVKKVQRSSHKTMASGSSYLKLGIYRSNGGPTSVVWHDGLRITAP